MGKQARDLAAAWGREGEAQVSRPRFLERGDVRDVGLDESFLDPGTEDCVTVGVLSMPNLSFVLLFQDEELDPRRRAWPVPSAAGVAEVTRCGARKPLLATLALQMRSRRGVLEVVVVRSSHPPKPAAEVLRGRHAGSSVPSPQVGTRPHLDTLKTRLAAKVAYYRQNRAEQVEQTALTADESGQGSAVLQFAEGCHELDLFVEAQPQNPPDLDAHLFTLVRGTEVSSDEEQSSQPHMTHCLGRPERLRVDFSGSPPKAEVVLLHASYSLPETIPATWGPLARGHLGQALHEQGVFHLPERPTFSSLGVRGTTLMHVPVDPRTCYALAAAPIRGSLDRLSLAALWGAEVRHNQGMVEGRGAALSFCADGSDHVTVEVQALGTSLAWIVGAWPIVAGRGVIP